MLYKLGRKWMNVVRSSTEKKCKEPNRAEKYNNQKNMEEQISNLENRVVEDTQVEQQNKVL